MTFSFEKIANMYVKCLCLISVLCILLFFKKLFFRSLKSYYFQRKSSLAEKARRFALLSSKVFSKQIYHENKSLANEVFVGIDRIHRYAPFFKKFKTVIRICFWRLVIFNNYSCIATLDIHLNSSNFIIFSISVLVVLTIEHELRMLFLFMVDGGYTAQSS